MKWFLVLVETDDDEPDDGSGLDILVSGNDQVPGDWRIVSTSFVNK